MGTKTFVQQKMSHERKKVENHWVNRKRIINHKVLLTNQLPEDKTETASARVESSTVFSFSCPHSGRFAIRLLLYYRLFQTRSPYKTKGKT